MFKEALIVEDMQVSYGDKQVLDHVTIQLETGSCCAVVGPNGAGKSTLFKAILCLEKSSYSRLRLLGREEDLRRVIRDLVAYIPQAKEVNWSFPVRVYDVVMMGRFSKQKGFLKKPSVLDKEIVESALETMGLKDLKNRQIDQLSGGQQQRVFIARALAQEACLYIMDEPLAGVDIKTEEVIMDTLKSFQNQGKTSLVIHHDLSSLKKYFNHLIWLNRTVIASGELDRVLTLENYRATYQTQNVLLDSEIFGG